MTQDNSTGCDSDVEQAACLINEKQFMKVTLHASRAPVLNRVVITNLWQNVDEDLIVLHLEQRRVTLVDDVEVDVEEFDETNHAAIVTLTDASGKHLSHISVAFVSCLFPCVTGEAGRYLVLSVRMSVCLSRAITMINY